MDYTKEATPKDDFFQLLSDHFKYENKDNVWKYPSSKKIEQLKKGGKGPTKSVKAVEYIRHHSTERLNQERKYKPKYIAHKKSLKKRSKK